MIVFLEYLFNEHNLTEYMKDEWLKLYDVPWVDNLISSVLTWLPDVEALISKQEEKVYMAKKAEEEEANSFGAKSSQFKGTVPRPFNLSESKPTPLPAPEIIPEPVRPKPVPPKREGPTPEEAALAEAFEENRRRVAEQYADPNLVFRLRVHERPMNIEKVRAEVESELARVATFKPPPSKPAPKFANQPKREVKLNAAAILREDALYKKKQLEEAKMIEKFETELRDDSEFTRWQSQMKAADDEARRLKVEQTKKEMEEAFKAALQARVDQVDANAKMVEHMRAEMREAEEKRVEELRELEEDNRKKREKVIADKAGVERAREELMEERKAAAERRNQEKAAAALKLAEEKALEQQRKAELVRQLRALEAVPKKEVRDVKGEQSTTAGLGLLEDMSLAELKERLVVAKRRAKEEEDDRREVINRNKRDKEALLREKMNNIARVRNLAGAQATQRRAETAEEAAAAATALRLKNEREAALLAERTAAKRAAQKAEKERLEAEEKAIKFKNERFASSKELLEERKRHDLDKGFARTEQGRAEQRRREKEAAAIVQRQKNRIIKTNAREEKKEKSSFMRAYDEKLRQLAAADQTMKRDEAEYKRHLVETEHARVEEMRERLGPMKAGVGAGSLAKSGLLPPRPVGSSTISPPRSPRATRAQFDAEGFRA